MYKKIQYLTFDLKLGVKVNSDVPQYPLHHMTNAPANKRRCIYMKIHYLTLVTLNVAQFPLHHVTYAATKSKVAMSNGLGGDTF